LGLNAIVEWNAMKEEVLVVKEKKMNLVHNKVTALPILGVIRLLNARLWYFNLVK
jgi:hypothetical protein